MIDFSWDDEIVDQMKSLIDDIRFFRAIQIPDNHMDIFFIQHVPQLEFFVQIEGSYQNSYALYFNANKKIIYHDCPDFIKRQNFCKHWAKLTTSLPDSYIKTVISLFKECKIYTKKQFQKNVEARYLPRNDCEYIVIPKLFDIHFKELLELHKGSKKIAQYLNDICLEQIINNPGIFLELIYPYQEYDQFFEDLFAQLAPTYQEWIDIKIHDQKIPEWLHEVLQKSDQKIKEIYKKSLKNTPFFLL